MKAESSHGFIERLAERLAAGLEGRRHQDLVRAMMHELQSIADPAPRRRFALGVIVALLRLRLSGRLGSPAAHGRMSGNLPLPDPRGGSMSELTPARLLRRHLAPFGLTLVLLTTFLFGSSSLGWLFQEAAPLSVRIELLLLAMPAALALTIPMAVFVAVLWAFARLAREGTLSGTLRDQRGRRRLIRTVVGGGAAIAALLMISNAELLPRANARISETLAGAPVVRNDRSMTLWELREAAARARAEGGVASSRAANAYEVEFQKKIALAVSCLILALAAAVIGIRYHRAGLRVVLAASTIVFTVYYLSLIGGEALANDGRISPFVSMWAANGAMLLVAFILGRRLGVSADLPVGEGAPAG